MILIDWMMPELSGWETARRVRELVHENASIVLMASAHGLAELSARTQSNPNVVDALLLKPVTTSALIDSVTALQAPRNRVAVTDRPASARRLSGLKILVVDDYALSLETVSELLSIEGAQVALAENGREAIEKVMGARIPFDVVLMDVQMPDMNGYETTRRLRELPQMADAAILAVTANAMDADKAACLAAGMDGYVPKPIDLEEVVGAILGQTRHTRTARFNPVVIHAAPLTIEIEAALQRIGNNRPLFATIAGRFIETSGSLIDELHAFLKAGALSEAAKTLHRLKGTAGTVGNVPLAQMASRLETALNRTGRLPDPDNDLAGLESLLAAGNGELERFLASFDAAPEAVESTRKPDRAATREQTRNLIALLGERNLSALDVYQKLGPALKASLPGRLHAALATAMEGFDFAAAASVLHSAEPNLWP
jgi:CheY-like chemotaxis protein